MDVISHIPIRPALLSAMLHSEYHETTNRYHRLPRSEGEVSPLPLLAVPPVALLNGGEKVRHRNARRSLQLNRVEQKRETTKIIFFQPGRASREKEGAGIISTADSCYSKHSRFFTRRMGARVS